VGSVFGLVRFLLPVCRLSWFLYTLNIHCICTFFVTFFSATIDDRDLIFGHKLHIGTPYRGKRFWTHQIPSSCLPTLLIFIHIEHTFCICPLLVAFFSATIDGRNLIFGHKLYIGTPYRGKRFWPVRFLLPVCRRAGVSYVNISSQFILLSVTLCSKTCLNLTASVVYSTVDHVFEPRSGQTKDYKIGNCCFSVKHTALRRNNKVGSESG
jgi:hypothetical protein